ncbi:YdcF family protein [Lewinella cohaerens]|uniref:YdcF family protein n=1 Tax=Lewinella cohaerens TaxID=70995 RepID=UPI00037A74E2|nr:ElyC/SanA/YdcF family protein [Lewinella cohaerens]
MLRLLTAPFLDPLLHFYLAAFIAALLYWRGKHQLAKITAIYSVFWLLLVSASPLPKFLAENRESRYTQLDDDIINELEKQAVNILVLGAGHSNAPGFTVHDRLSEPALKRLLEGVRIKQQLPQAKLICSGYSASGRQPQAEVLAEMALQLGVAPQDTLLQPTAHNTEAEALAYRQRFSDTIPLVLVTSALHIPRALYWFRHHGLDPIPAPTNHLVMPDPGYESFAFKPSTRKIDISAKLLHEYAGMVHAWFKVGDQK